MSYVVVNIRLVLYYGMIVLCSPNQKSMDNAGKRPFVSAFSQKQAHETWEELKLIVVASPEFVRKRSKQRVDLFFFLNLAEQALNE